MSVCYDPNGIGVIAINRPQIIYYEENSVRALATNILNTLYVRAGGGGEGRKARMQRNESYENFISHDLTWWKFGPKKEFLHEEVKEVHEDNRREDESGSHDTASSGY